MFGKNANEKEKKLSALLPKNLLSDIEEIPYFHLENVSKL